MTKLVSLLGLPLPKATICGFELLRNLPFLEKRDVAQLIPKYSTLVSQTLSQVQSV